MFAAPARPSGGMNHVDLAEVLRLPDSFRNSGIFREGKFPLLERLDAARDFRAIFGLLSEHQDNTDAFTFHLHTTRDLIRWNIVLEGHMWVENGLRVPRDFAMCYFALTRGSAPGAIIRIAEVE